MDYFLICNFLILHVYTLSTHPAITNYIFPSTNHAHFSFRRTFQCHFLFSNILPLFQTALYLEMIQFSESLPTVGNPFENDSCSFSVLQTWSCHGFFSLKLLLLSKSLFSAQVSTCPLLSIAWFRTCILLDQCLNHPCQIADLRT